MRSALANRVLLSAVVLISGGMVSCSSKGGGTGLPGTDGGFDTGTASTDDAGNPGAFGDGGGVATGVCDPADRSSLDIPLTVCTQTSEAYPGEVVPACTGNPAKTTCPPQKMGIPAPAQRCGTMIGCPLERNRAIAGTVPTTYTPPPANYIAPEPPHDPGADPISPMGTWMHAESTAWFGRPSVDMAQTVRNTDQPGSCGITSTDLMVLAIPQPQFGQNNNPGPDVWNLAYWCGACAEVVGPTGRRVRVQVVTQRGYDNDGNYYSIDLPANGFHDARVDTPYSLIDDRQICSIGMPVDWRIVPCEVCGGIVLTYLPGYNPGGPGFRIYNHRLPIVDLYYMPTGSTAWQRVQRDSANQYHTQAADPMRLRVVAIDGSTIEGDFPAYVSGKSYEATSQF